MRQILYWVTFILATACVMVLVDEFLFPLSGGSADLLPIPQIERTDSVGDSDGSTATQSQDALPDSTQPTPDEGAQATPALPTPPRDSGELLNEDLWATRMSLPSADAVASYVAPDRSPYIVCRPQFSSMDAYTEYAVDFKADAQPRGTYLSVCNWDMDLSELRSRYSDVHRDYEGVAAYAGFQVLDDGSRVAIMSVWDTYITDSSGADSIIHAVRTYPDTYRVSKPFEGEGSGIQTIVDYDWKQGQPYRALIQCDLTASGTCELSFYVMALQTGHWDKLIAYDLGFGNTCMTDACAFLEDYLVEEASEVRTMELWNFRAREGGGSWVPAYSATMEQNYEYPGSYNYGSDGSVFWAITSAVPDLCTHPADGEQFSVTEAQGGSPYE